jgi:cell division protein FtsB
MLLGVDLYRVLLNWLPMLLLIAVWVYFMRKTGISGSMSYSQYLEATLAEQRKQNELLNAVIDKLDKRISNLEDRA